MTLPTVFKTCSRCDIEKPESEFYLDPDGEPYNPCRSCKAESVRVRRERERAERASGSGERRTLVQRHAEVVERLEALERDLGAERNFVRALRDLLISKGVIEV